MLIAIQPDENIFRNNVRQSYSDRWAERIKELGHDLKWVDVFQGDPIEQIRNCDGFMWRFTVDPSIFLYAKRLLFALEQGMNMPVFPNRQTAWHHDDKIAQDYLLKSAGIPLPESRVFWSKDDALKYCHETRYPFVLKLSIGASSKNVKLINKFSDAERWINEMFGPGLFTLNLPKRLNYSNMKSRILPTFRFFVQGKHPDPGYWFELQKNYFYVQEFLPGNDFDTRITVIGNRAFGFRRFNRKGDFRASGSGSIDWSVDKIDTGFVRLAFKVSKILHTQSVAIDGLYKNGDHTLVEICYTYASWAVKDCPGHWELAGSPDEGELKWIDGHLCPEDAILEDFLLNIQQQKKH